jgi:hypothetical protein
LISFSEYFFDVLAIPRSLLIVDSFLPLVGFRRSPATETTQVRTSEVLFFVLNDLPILRSRNLTPGSVSSKNNVPLIVTK